MTKWVCDAVVGTLVSAKSPAYAVVVRPQVAKFVSHGTELFCVAG
jgi:hypothetical protein